MISLVITVIWVCVHVCLQVDRVLEGMTIWQQEQEDLAEHAQLCSAAGRKQVCCCVGGEVISEC